FEEMIEVKLPEDVQEHLTEILSRFEEEKTVERLWNRDASVWTGADEGDWLTWLDIVEEQLEDTSRFAVLREEIKNSSIDSVLLLGMGGSSLCPEVLSMTFGKEEGFPRLQILDSTSPEQIKSLADSIEPKKTIFVVASKSGTTLEPNIFMAYFLDVMKKELG